MEAEPGWRSFAELPRAFGDPPVGGRLRAEPGDFQVDEIPAFTPDGDGEHVLLRVRKAGANTEWVARRLASHAGVAVSKVGFAGLKDRHAVATQWFSLHLGLRAEPDWGAFAADGVEILELARHRRKLRRGGLRGNRFRIRVRDPEIRDAAIGRRIDLVRRRGVPNYFGPQRFGRDGGNLRAAAELFAGRAGRAGRHVRGLWISAARSQLFNEVLAARVRRGDWDRPLPGERLQLAGSRSHFLAEALDPEITRRVQEFDLHPTGPLWGAGDALCGGASAELERSVIRQLQPWADGLAAVGLRQERRSLRLPVAGLEVFSPPGVLELAFELPAGAYATAVLREIVDWSGQAA
jgi:tRNA pseudouridine13 synthase